MKEKSIDARIIPILCWSILVQIIFLLISAFSPRFALRTDEMRFALDLSSFISALILILLLILLLIPAIRSKINKTNFLAVLFLLASITILARSIPPSLEKSGWISLIKGGINLLRWDTTFYLFIPLVFIAWQYSLREVVFYCIYITLLDILPFRIFGEGDNFFFAISMMGNIVRGFSLGIIGWIAYSLVDLQRSQQRELEAANRKLRKYALTAERLAQSQERNRIAREMHDTLAHTLSGVAVQLEAIKALFSKKPQQAKQVLDRTLENTRHGLDETRRALVDMRSSAVETYGLKQAIENLVISTAERGGFQSKVSFPAGDVLLDEEASHCIYRSVQEALENSIKHSNAKNIGVTLENQPNKITLKIEDDGEGFNPKTLRKEQMGIRGMRERVELLGGTLSINSKLDKGTNIIIQLPRSDD